MITGVADGHISLSHATWIATVVGFAAWPFMLTLSVAVKWIVVGRYKPGRYPLWSGYYLRWWIANRFQALAWAEMFRGTPLMSLYWRAMGAKIGRNVTISTPFCSAFDVVSIGDNSSVGLEDANPRLPCRGWISHHRACHHRQGLLRRHALRGGSRYCHGRRRAARRHVASGRWARSSPPVSQYRGVPAMPAVVTVPGRKSRGRSASDCAACCVARWRASHSAHSTSP